MMMLKYDSISELVEAAGTGKISELVLADQSKAMDIPAEDIYSRMEKSFDVMCEAVKSGQDEHVRSMSGLTGGEGFKMKNYSETGGLS